MVVILYVFDNLTSVLRYNVIIPNWGHR